MNKILSIIVPVYITDYKGWLNEAFDDLEDLAKMDGVEVIIVDDDSAKKIPIENYPNIKFVRWAKKHKWNQPAARNLGVAMASGDWVLLTDIDHTIPKETILSVLKYVPTTVGEVLENRCYVFDRIKDGKQINPHYNSFFIKRKNMLPYDERFCGSYGYDDTFHRVLLRATGIDMTVTDIPISVRNTNDAHSLIRDKSKNEKLLIQLEKELEDEKYKLMTYGGRIAYASHFPHEDHRSPPDYRIEYI